MALSFALSDQQVEFQQVVRRFARERVAPRARELNATGEYPVELVREMGALGLLGVPFPERYGGAGGDLLTLCLAVEEVGRVDQSLGATLESAVVLGAMPLFRFGTEDQKRRWLVPLARGQRVAAFGLTEPSGGTDTARLRTEARRDGSGWAINGRKAFIGNAGTKISSHVTITAVTGERDGRAEVTSFVVPTGTSGYVIGDRNPTVGWRSVDNRDLSFEDCWVPADHQLGERGRGLANFLAVLDEGRVAIAALAVGLIQGCVDECLRYAHEREAFGRPIGAYQSVAFKIADLEMGAQLARDAYRRAAWLQGTGQAFSAAASVAKLYATETAVSAAREACQLFGGYGCTTEAAVGRFYQDAKILEIGEGTSEVQRMVIARELGLPRR